MIWQVTTVAALHVFQAVIATAVGRSAPLATAVAGGVLRRTVRALSGAAAWIAEVAMCTDTAAISSMGSLSVASGIINLLPICLLERYRETVELRKKMKNYSR